GEHDRWDLAVRSGFFGGARLLMGVEDHGGGQLVRLRWWPYVPAFGPVLTVGLAVLALGALHDDAWPAAALRGPVAVLVAGRTVPRRDPAVRDRAARGRGGARSGADPRRHAVARLCRGAARPRFPSPPRGTGPASVRLVSRLAGNRRLRLPHPAGRRRDPEYYGRRHHSVRRGGDHPGDDDRRHRAAGLAARARRPGHLA